MIHFPQNCKFVVGLAPISINSGAATALTCDTLGYNYATAIIQFGVIGSAATVMKMQESATDFSGTDVGTAYTATGSTGNLRLPQTSDAGTTFVYGIPLGGARKRYLQMAITTGSTTLVSVQWVLSKANIFPNSATEMGVAAYVFG